MNLSYLEAWFLALLLTQVAEAPIYAVFAPVRWPQAFIPSLVTHPFVWFVFPPLGTWVGLSFDHMLIVAEVWVWLVEAVILRGLGVTWRRALVVSAVANVTSILFGMATRYWFGIP